MASDSVAELTRQSSFVFQGAVRRMGAVTSRGVKATSATAVVSVEKVIKGPDVLSQFMGKEITVALKEHEHTSAGARAVFFTNGLHFGEGLAVREVGRVDANSHETERAVHEAMKQADDEELLHRMRDARFIVSGVVAHCGPTDRRERVGTEHDPEWWECVIEVESIEKGTVKPEKGKGGAGHITAFFAHSLDVMWYRSPKFVKGDRGVFLLHDVDFRSRPTPGPAAVLPLDFRPLSDLEHVRSLVKRIPR